MHKYFRAIGDYAKDTRHLTMIEHGAYTLMLDICYATEKPLPDNLPSLFRLCLARSKAEQEAVESVLSEFFTPAVGGGWTQKRVQKELLDYSGTSDGRRYAVFCRMWTKEFKKKRQVVDYETWTQGLESFFKSHPTVKRESIDYQLMVIWYSNAFQPRTSNQEPVTSNQEPVFPQDYPAGHVAALSKWWNYKKQKRESYKETGWSTLLNQQLKFTSDQVEQSVEISISSNYSGLFTHKVTNPVSSSQGFSWQKKEKEAAAADVPESRGTAAPDGWEGAMVELWGDDWQEVYAAWELMPQADQRQVRAWLDSRKEQGGELV